MGINITEEVGPQVAFGTPLIGSIVSYGCIIDSNSLPPDGWLLCNGTAISRSTYVDLFQVIGTLHGAGDGVNTFNLPDYRGRFQRGVAEGTGRDPDANNRQAANIGGAISDNIGSIESQAVALPVGSTAKFTTTDSNPSTHQHSVNNLPTDRSWYYIAGSHYAAWNDSSVASGDSGAHTHTINGGGDADTCPINLYLNYIIYYGSTH